MILDKKNISEILNLKSSELIGESIAFRQTEVIRRGFNYLNNTGNNVLYIADEVGLGKTYIALGIASLLRHFSDSPANYQDVIIVPKSNLQKKWEKEIKQFIAKNYLKEDNRVKSIIRKPVGELRVIEKLRPIAEDHPAYHIYRNSQFSLGLVYSSKKDLKESLLANLNLPAAREILKRAEGLEYFFVDNKPRLKKLYAYLLSVCNPPIELLIVDEGHNFKHGLGVEDYQIVSDRNNVVVRFMGIKQSSPDDKKIFEDFPELRNLVKPKVKKLIVLSATPKTHSLTELRNQLDCFMPVHILSGLKTEKEILPKLEQFVIRGNMEYKIGGQSYSRNLCRFEHRNGNAEKSIDAPALLVQNNEQALILGLLQYNTIKHLNNKYNASFEIGMLAGFETFVVDQEKRSSAKLERTGEPEREYEDVKNKKVQVSQDHSIIKEIIESYKLKFGCYPPHPKQDAIVEAVFRLMLTGEKSLIFVRRINSAYELEKRLLNKWEQEIHNELAQGCTKTLPSKELKQLIHCYNEYKTNAVLTSCIEDIFNKVISKFYANEALYPLDFLDTYGNSAINVLKAGLYHIYYNYKEINGGEGLYVMLCSHCKLNNIKKELVQICFDLLLATKTDWVKETETDDNEAGDDSYFFHSYFRQAHVKSFKKRLYNTDWFDLNFFILNRHFKIASFETESLQKSFEHAKDKSNNTEAQELFVKHIKEADFTEHFSHFDEQFSSLLGKTTLITEILIKGCEKEFLLFLDSLKGKSKSILFQEVKTLVTIIRSCLRNGSGFLPLFIADKAAGEFISNYLSIILKPESIFHLIIKEIRTIISHYSLLRAVNFPDGESHKEIETKLYYQTPVLGMTGQSTRNKSNVAAQFRMPGFPYTLVTTDIFREGEDLHTFCQNIYHYGIAWNCSDMEQRTGRIDRINSLSHRKLSTEDSIVFDNQLHAFYPFLKNTLEVNQVNKLYYSINKFVETFNDFTQDIEEDGTAGTGDAIETMHGVIKKQLHSKYEYTNFKGCSDIGTAIEFQNVLGLQIEELNSFLTKMLIALQDRFSYYFEPRLDTENFSIYGDMKLSARNERRGPFRIIINNSMCPGEFTIVASSYLFKISTKVQKILNEGFAKQDPDFKLGSIDEFYALSFEKSYKEYEEESFMKKLLQLVELCDSIEEEVMDEDDAVVFN